MAFQADARTLASLRGRMAMRYISLIAVTLLLIFSSATASAQDVGALIAQMQSADEGQRMAAIDAIANLGAPAVAPLFGLLEGQNREADVAARLAIQKIVYGASAPRATDRAAVAAALAEVAASPGRSGVRRHALEMISFVGPDQVVPTLARLLGDREVREMARWALVRIPGKAAVRALADALPAADGEFKVGLINALGRRGSVVSTPILRRALTDKDEAVRIAAAEALGRIADPESEPLLSKLLASASGRERRAAQDACLRLAETLLAAGRADRAGAMYRHLYREAQTDQAKCAALGGLAKVDKERAVPMLLKAMSSGESKLAGVAASALAAVPGEKATKMIAAAVGRSRPEVRLRLIGTLGNRRDAAALPVLFAVVERDRDAKVREAALLAMGQIGSPAAVPMLAKAAGDADEPVRMAAATALARLPGRSATRAIIAALGPAPANVRPVLVRVLGYRRDAHAIPAVIAAMKDGKPVVRLAAIRAAGDLAEAAAAPALLDTLRSGSADEQAAVEAALGRMRAGEARKAMVAALEGAPETTKASILRALGRHPEPELMPIYLGAAKDASEPVAMAGLEALAGLRDVRAAQTFVEAARTRTPQVSAVAVKGYLLLGGALFDREGETAVEISRLALQLPAADDVRRLALGAIARLRDAGSLPLVLPLLASDSLGGDATRTVAAIADGLARTDKGQAVGLYRQVVASGKDPNLVRDAVEKLRGLGVDMDPAAEAGFVTHWWVIGPFKGQKRLTKEDVIETSGPIDVVHKVAADGEMFEWRPARVDDPLGMLDLQRAVAEMDDCGAYMYAEVTSDAARDVLLKIGSDDDVVCWLNGKQIHAYWGGRGYAPDQDVVPARLHAGTSSILLKVLNQGAEWGAGVRITDPAGKPVVLGQRKP